MAQSPSHRFGQIIGDLLESAMFEPLRGIADEFGLYLDYKHLRSARGGKKVTWKDSKHNEHDLDYILEEGGSETVRGRPKAFIETAWRRYTKHSRNKVQEMQGAIQPLAETYGDCHPFLGVVLAGKFTAGSLNQLVSHGFHILFYPYETVVELFGKAGIDARFDEDTPDSELQAKMEDQELPAAARAEDWHPKKGTPERAKLEEQAETAHAGRKKRAKAAYAAGTKWTPEKGAKNPIQIID